MMEKGCPRDSPFYFVLSGRVASAARGHPSTPRRAGSTGFSWGWSGGFVRAPPHERRGAFIRGGEDVQRDKSHAHDLAARRESRYAVQTGQESERQLIAAASPRG